MIKEVVEEKIVDSIDSIVECVVNYVGQDYKEKIEAREEKIGVVLVRGNGVVELEDEERYIGEEPVCLQGKNKSYILLPVNILANKSGNVVFVHELLHALSSDDNFNYLNLKEVVIDYMANDIAKELEKKGINITLENNPSYESSSFYSNLFYLVDEFYAENKDELYRSVFSGEKLDVTSAMELEEKIDKKISEVIALSRENKNYTFKR